MNHSNDYQIGGDHYRIDYQHWDFVCDTKLHYLLACATKYIARYDKKNGSQDLEKAVHYINKAEECSIYVDQMDYPARDNWIKFYSQLSPIKQALFLIIYDGDYEMVINDLFNIIDDLKEKEHKANLGSKLRAGIAKRFSFIKFRRK